MFGKQGGTGAESATGATGADRPDAEHVFADVFEDVCVLGLCLLVVLTDVRFSCYVRRLSDMLPGGRGSVPSAVQVSASS